jgi:hypothetical protein
MVLSRKEEYKKCPPLAIIFYLLNDNGAAPKRDAPAVDQ